MDRLQKNLMVRDILTDIRDDIDDGEIIELILESKVSEDDIDRETVGQRAADGIARVAGNRGFIICFVLVLAVWMGINALFGAGAFDPYPFILLNLVLSCIAAIQAPLIMMSQNRQAEKDRIRAKNDYRVNLKNEIILEDLHTKLTLILNELHELRKGEPPSKGRTP